MMRQRYGYLIAIVLLLICLVAFGACNTDTAEVEAEQYEVNFSAEGEIVHTLKTSGNEQIRMPEHVDREGYIFNGWYLDEGTWTQLFLADAYANRPMVGDVNVYAKYTPIKYSLTYEPRGVEHNNPAEYTIEQRVELQPAVKQHYDFLGWYTDAAFTSPIFEIPEGVTGNMTLYAKWKPTEYKVTFVDGDNVIANVPYSVETSRITAPEVPEREGYVGEWESFKLTPGGITVKAVYTPVDYKLTYEGVTAKEHQNPAGYNVTEQPLKLLDATRAHYVFKGWYADAELTEQVTEIAQGTIGDVVLYAKWEPALYLAVFMDGDTVVAEVPYTVETESIEAPEVPLHVGYAGEWESYELKPDGITVNAVYTLLSYTLTYEGVEAEEHANPDGYDATQWPVALEDAVREYYVFDGWYTDAEYTQRVTEIAEGVAGDLVLYAKWSPEEYAATFMDGETVVAEVIYTIETESIEAPAVPLHVGYLGEWESFELVPGGITVNAVYTLVSYTLTYEGVRAEEHDNPAGYDVTEQPIALGDATREHYVFLGWYLDEQFTEQVTEIAPGMSGDLVLYAKWTPVEYVAVFMDGETVVAEVIYTIESLEIDYPEVPEHPGYVGKWGSYEQTETGIIVSAVYVAVPYRITYLGVKAYEHSNPAGYDVTDLPIVLADATREHYVFLGWYTDEALTEQVTEIAPGTTGDVVLYAKWTPVEYTATFMDGETVVGQVTYTVEDESIVAPEVPVYAGYESAWEAFEPVPGGITVNAVYTLITYSVTYENTKGAGHYNPLWYTVEDDAWILQELSMPGFVFDGWFMDGVRVTELPAGSIGDKVLTAAWTTIEYTIKLHFNPAEGKYAGASNPGSYTVEDTIVLTELVCKIPGYVFDGWYTAKNASEGYKVTELPLGSIGDVELYANYVPEQYTIKYEGIADAIHINPTTYTVETELFNILPAYRQGYVFEGWYTDKALTVPAELTVPKGSMGNIVLYVKWTPVTYAIEYDGMGGTLPENPATYDITQTLTLAAPTRTGYVFQGWYTEDGELLIQIRPGMTGNLKLYARWDVVYYPIHYHLYGGENAFANYPTYTIESANIPLLPATKPGYRFEGWYADPAYTQLVSVITEGSFGELTLYAKWSLAQYTVSYAVPQGTVHDNITSYNILGEYEALRPATLTGYIFDGWYKDAEYTQAITHVLGTGEYGDLTLYAKFIPKQYHIWLGSTETTSYTVTFDPLNGADVFSQVVTMDQGLTFPRIPQKAGYVFAGWYDNAECKGKVFDMSVPVMGDVTLYAKWVETLVAVQANQPINVTLNGAVEQKFTFVSLTDTPIVITTVGGLDTCGKLYDAEGNLLVESDDVSDTDKNFQIIYNATAGQAYTVAVYGFSDAIKGNVTLSISGHATVAAGGKAYLENLYFVESGAAYKLTVPAARPGFKFLGWADADGVLYTNGNGVSLEPWHRDADVVLHEVWEETIYDVIFDSDGGSDVDSFKKNAGEWLDVTGIVPERVGYRFLGWTLDGRLYTMGIMPEHSITLKALWQEIRYSITYENTMGVAHENATSYTVNSFTLWLEELSKPGYVFDGWFLDGQKVTEIPAGSTGDKVLTAAWTPIDYSIKLHYSPMEGTYAGAQNPDTYTVEDALTLIDLVSTIPGYKFAGWYTAKNAGEGELVTEIPEGSMGDIELYARYEIEVYNITYVGAENALHINPLTYTVETELFGILPAYRPGYVFDGWYTDRALTVPAELNVPKGSTGDIVLYVKWTPITYTVTYECMGGTLPENPATYNTTQTYTLAAPTKQGYVFLGWFTTPVDPAEGEEGEIGVRIEQIVPGMTGDMVLYARWEVAYYTIHYNLYGGENALMNYPLYTIETPTIPLLPATKPGYAFKGWYADPTFKTPVYMIPTGSYGDVELYAKWDLLTYSISYRVPGGAEHDNVYTYTVEDEITALKPAERVGWTFVGWYKDEACTLEITQLPSAGVYGDLTLYAKFVPNQYNIWLGEDLSDGFDVLFVPNYDGGTYDMQTVTAAQGLVFPRIPERDGYVFAGWYDNYECKGEVYDFSVPVLSDIVLYAKWIKTEAFIPINGCVELTLNGAAEQRFTVVSMVDTVITFATQGDIDTYGVLYDAYGNEILRNDDASEGDKNFKIEHRLIAGRAYTIVVSGFSNSVQGSTKLTVSGHAEVAAGGKAFYPNMHVVSTDAHYTLPVPAARPYYRFLGWADAFGYLYTDGQGNSLRAWNRTLDITLYEKWEETPYTVYFDSNGGSYFNSVVVYTGEKLYVGNKVPTRSGYTFEGWYLDGERITTVAHGGRGDIVLTAKWKPIVYSLTLHFIPSEAGYEDLKSNPAEYTIEKYILLEDLVCKIPGYRFAGWYTDKIAGQRVYEIERGTMGNIELYARYTPIYYSITYQNAGMPDVYNPNPWNYTVESETFNILPAERPHYVFDGWYTDEALTVLADLTVLRGSIGNITLYAKWTPITYTITYNGMGGVLPENPATYDATQEIESFAEPTRDGYEFRGWYTDPVGGHAVKNISAGSAGDLVLYARWRACRYAIRYELFGGINAPENLTLTSYTIESATVTFAEPTREGFIFGGWFIDAECAMPITEIAHGSIGSVTVYAKWIPVIYNIAYDGMGGELPENPATYNTTETITLASPTRDGYVFVGWYNAYGERIDRILPGMMGDITLYAAWNTVEYSISYELNGGINAPENLTSYNIETPGFAPVAPFKSGYVFEGWFADAEYTDTPVVEIVQGSYGDLVLYAKWSPVKYTITYELPEGAVHDNVKTYTVESETVVLRPAMRTAWTFAGWYLDAEYIQPIEQISGAELIGDLTVYAKFVPKTYYVWIEEEQVDRYTVTFDPNGGDGEVISQTVTVLQGIEYPEIPTRAGYLFAGWYDNAACEGSVYDLSAPVAADVTLYAKWVAYTNCIKTGVPVSITLDGITEYRFTFVSLLDAVITFETEGSQDTCGALYDAEGNLLTQNDDADLGNKNFRIDYAVTAGQVYTLAVWGYSDMVQGSATLYANGLANPVAGGKVICDKLIIVHSGEYFTMPVPEPRIQYKFLGWADQDGVLYTDGQGVSLAPWNTDNDVVLHELWEEMIYDVVFDTNGGEPVDTIRVYTGKILSLGNIIPKREGYLFTGWTLDGEPFVEGEMPDHPITLVATWEELKVSVIMANRIEWVSCERPLTAESLGVYGIDNAGNIYPVELTWIGELVPGQTVTLVFSIPGKYDSVIGNVKVYGNPTFGVTNTTLNMADINFASGKIDPALLGAYAVDSFGEKLTVKQATLLDSKPTAEMTVTVRLQATDVAGNTATMDVMCMVVGKPDPNAPVFFVPAADMASSLPGSPDIADATLSADGSFMTITTGTAGDPYYMPPMMLGKGYVANVIAIKYRTLVDGVGGEMYIGSGPSPTGAGDHVTFDYVGDGKWHLAIIDLAQVPGVVDGVVNYVRWDVFRSGCENVIDMAYIAAFASADAAYAYDAMLGNPGEYETETEAPGTEMPGTEAPEAPTQGKQSDYTVEDVKGWVESGMTLEEVRDKLKSEGYPATELAWILKTEYETPSEMQEFFAEYGETADVSYMLDMFECDLDTLMKIFCCVGPVDPEDTESETAEPTPSEPVESYVVPKEQWTVSGHSNQVVTPDTPGVGHMVAVSGVDSGALLHQGSVGVGEIDLSLYSKAIVYYGIDNSSITLELYDVNAYNRIMLTCVDNTDFSPEESTVIAAATYFPEGWQVVAIEIDLTDVWYAGPVYVTWDTLPGSFMLINSIEFV